ncbi:hypothetical protein SCHPADRAFT_735427 [Schizopora paradoxa]|uniref:Uncharacterized protein n=1 Tax=Schizopora paradoxa TaxID=27342 RepID=A0A0H2R1E3_9AGAM|nr:hypothetical protein SCHPADRAFT_735427 [Schizopora paradoxa]
MGRYRILSSWIRRYRKSQLTLSNPHLSHQEDYHRRRTRRALFSLARRYLPPIPTSFRSQKYLLATQTSRTSRSSYVYTPNFGNQASAMYPDFDLDKRPGVHRPGGNSSLHSPSHLSSPTPSSAPPIAGIDQRLLILHLTSPSRPLHDACQAEQDSVCDRQASRRVVDDQCTMIAKYICGREAGIPPAFLVVIFL